MPRFFIHRESPATVGETVFIEGADAAHIRRSLRMTAGDPLTLCDGQGHDYETVIERFTETAVCLSVKTVTKTQSEPSLFVTLYQGLPKSDKMEWIIQKSVELGVSRVVPVVTSRSIAKPGDKVDRKVERWQKIADEAAGQSGRGIRPEVTAPLSWKQAVAEMTAAPLLVCYEAGGQPFSAVLSADMTCVGVFIGPEGGISPAELDTLTAAGAIPVTLGKRILRCETAPIAALTLLMGLTGNMD